MKREHVGLLIIGIAVLIGLIVFLFNRALTNIVNETCTHGSSCPMWQSISFQTYIGLGIMLFVVAVGFFFVFFKVGEPEKGTNGIKKVTKDDFKSQIKNLDKDEKAVFEKVIEEEGTIFQSALVEKSGFTKVKVTRILDKLEGKGLIERKRRGMSNVIVLKH